MEEAELGPYHEKTEDCPYLHQTEMMELLLVVHGVTEEVEVAVEPEMAQEEGAEEEQDNSLQLSTSIRPASWPDEAP